MSEAGAPFKLLRCCIPRGDELLGIRRTISFPLSVSEKLNHIDRNPHQIERGVGWVKVSSQQGTKGELNDVRTSYYLRLLTVRFDVSKAACSLIVVIHRAEARRFRHHICTCVDLLQIHSVPNPNLSSAARRFLFVHVRLRKTWSTCSYV